MLCSWTLEKIKGSKELLLRMIFILYLASGYFSSNHFIVLFIHLAKQRVVMLPHQILALQNREFQHLISYLRFDSMHADNATSIAVIR